MTYPGRDTRGSWAPQPPLPLHATNHLPAQANASAPGWEQPRPRGNAPDDLVAACRSTSDGPVRLLPRGMDLKQLCANTTQQAAKGRSERRGITCRFRSRPAIDRPRAEAPADAACRFDLVVVVECRSSADQLRPHRLHPVPAGASKRRCRWASARTDCVSLHLRLEPECAEVMWMGASG
jgi:hypothetical protein